VLIEQVSEADSQVVSIEISDSMLEKTERRKRGENNKACWEKREIEQDQPFLLLFSRKILNMNKKALSATSYCRDIGREKLLYGWTQWMLRHHNA